MPRRSNTYYVIMRVCVCSLYCHLWPLWLDHIFPHHLINSTIFGNIDHKMCVLIISTNSLRNISHSKKNSVSVTINVHSSACKVTIIIVRFDRNLNFLNRFLKNTQLSNFMKICPLRAEMLHADRKLDKWTNVTKLAVAFHSFANNCCSR